ncbi:hypothetical protein GGS21DRAFT_170509 [Xylaria nigripes]|nr:hypothetical protein GGS21DRAFT_170509 [Xylaria nigripes]
MDVPAQIRSGLRSQGLPPPSLAWIQNAMPNRTPLPPLQALIATVRTRFLATDLTNSALFDSLPPVLPPNASSPEAKEAMLNCDILVQVLDIDNLSKSKWEQVEELEAIARGEQTKGREIIRLANGDEHDESGLDGPVQQSTAGDAERPGPQIRGGSAISTTFGNTATKASTHRLVLQDCKGQKVHGLELKRIDKIGIGSLNIGEKILLKRGAIVARGTLLLEPTTCIILGGKVEVWQKVWVESRLSRLREAVGAESNNVP